jgi:hypothetical protein
MKKQQCTVVNAYGTLQMVANIFTSFRNFGFGTSTTRLHNAMKIKKLFWHEATISGCNEIGVSYMQSVRKG